MKIQIALATIMVVAMAFIDAKAVRKMRGKFNTLPKFETQKKI